MHRATVVSLLVLAATGGAAWAQNPAVTVQVDAGASRHPINPNVYGTAYADPSALADLNVPFHRWGGNNTSRYNWQQNADNRGGDWYYESIPYASASPGGEADSFVSQTFNASAQAGLTVPMVGWVAKLGAGRSKLSSFSRAKYGDQADCDFTWFPDACNGLRPDGVTPVTGNNPADASVPADALFQRGWVDHLGQQWGRAWQGGVRYYLFDNESSIWFATHRDVHPVGPTMDEIRDKMIDYGTRVKESDSTALLVGPEEWGWSGYFYSGYDQQYVAQNGYSFFPDRTAHGGADFLPWLLDQLRQHEQASGQRVLDVFSVHYYPQGGEFGNDVSTAMQLRRNRSTRSLWDPAYVDESWIGDKVRLVPRLKQWVAAYYPGTLTAINEYNWGAEGHINGATTQADILGIFGREGLDMAARWTTPAASTPTYKAIKLYRNYDGARSTFGDVSVSAVAPTPDNVSAFASVRSTDGALTIMVVAKQLSGTTPVTVQLAGFNPAGTARRFQLTAANVITPLADIAVGAGGFTTSVPSPSVTLFVLPAAAPNRLRGDFNGDAQSDILWQNASTGQVQIWTMNGAKRTAATLTTPPGEADLNWKIAGTADFNLDGKSDILWRHAATGQLQVWSMNGATRLNALPTNPASVPDLNWYVAATGDFNADGKPDILWRHALSGRNVVWIMDGVVRTAGMFLNPDILADTGWRMVGAADFNADGWNDILWRHSLSGKTVVWFMNGINRTAGAFTNPAGLSDLNWQLGGTADYDHDGQPDLLWHNLVSGRNVLWLMNGASRSFALATTPETQSDTNWQIVGPK